MTAIRRFLVTAFAVVTALWWLADTPWPQPSGWFPFRTAFVQYTGVVAMAAMSLAMMLALRPRWLEPRLGGLDKMYRLHKWLGIGALVVATLHWWWAQGTKWMVGWGWLQRPARGPRAAPVTDTIAGWLASQRGLAEDLGEWACYAAVVLLVLALARRVPYHWFRRTHRWIALAYLVLVFHAVVLVKPGYWSHPIGWLLAALMMGGSVAAVLALVGRIGAGRRVEGTVESVVRYPALDVLEARIALAEGWPGHAAGQFAFVTSDRHEGAHPYTIASAWQPGDSRITFITKALGDHTRRLQHTLAPGQPVTVEGPYGRFDFADAPRRQVWIGAGIGITPFVARMKQLACDGGGAGVDLFHATAVTDPAAIGKLQADAQAAGVRLHLLADDRGDGRLDGARLRAAVPDWVTASVWFCGPAVFGRTLRADLVRHGLPRARFHQELFELR